jgi:nicotinamidase-related amidase
MGPKSTAVVLIEYQNDFTSDGGTLHQAVKPVMDKTNMLANTVETVKKARELGATIVSTVSEEEQRLAVEKNYPMFSKPMTHDEFLTSLESGEAVETKAA